MKDFLLNIGFEYDINQYEMILELFLSVDKATL
jgi:hypothetical protein